MDISATEQFEEPRKDMTKISNEVMGFPMDVNDRRTGRRSCRATNNVRQRGKRVRFRNMQRKCRTFLTRMVLTIKQVRRNAGLVRMPLSYIEL
jgi:hypothetical protein